MKVRNCGKLKWRIYTNIQHTHWANTWCHRTNQIGNITKQCVQYSEEPKSDEPRVRLAKIQSVVKRFSVYHRIGFSQKIRKIKLTKVPKIQSVVTRQITIQSLGRFCSQKQN